MKSTNKIMAIAAVTTLSFSLLFQACKKDGKSSSSTTTITQGQAEVNAVTMGTTSAAVSNAYNEALNLALQTGVDGSTLTTGFTPGIGSGNSRPIIVTGDRTITISCATITVSPADTTTWPKTVTIDFGAGCTDPLGTTRKGVITYIFSGKILMPGAIATATYSGYSVDGYQLSGTYTITNHSSGDSLSFTTKVTGGNVITPDGLKYAYEGSKTVTQTAGQDTWTLVDNEYHITGADSLTSSDGQYLIDSVTTPLLWKMTCAHIVSGVIAFDYSYSGMSVKGTLDYGNGECDSLATIKVGPLTTTITIP